MGFYIFDPWVTPWTRSRTAGPQSTVTWQNGLLVASALGDPIVSKADMRFLGLPAVIGSHVIVDGILNASTGGVNPHGLCVGDLENTKLHHEPGTRLFVRNGYLCVEGKLSVKQDWRQGIAKLPLGVDVRIRWEVSLHPTDGRVFLTQNGVPLPLTNEGRGPTMDGDSVDKIELGVTAWATPGAVARVTWRDIRVNVYVPEGAT